MEKKMATIGILVYIWGICIYIGLYKDNGKEHGSYRGLGI